MRKIWSFWPQTFPDRPDLVVIHAVDADQRPVVDFVAHIHDGEVTGVELHGVTSDTEGGDFRGLAVPEPLRPSDLGRFPWKRFMQLARVTALTQGAWSEDLGVAVDEALAETSKRPGRRGHPREFYARIATRYLELASDPAPATRIAEEERASASTVRTWLQRCEELELIPPRVRRRKGTK